MNTGERRKFRRSRRTPEEIERDNKMKATCAEKVAGAVVKSWDDIRDAEGDIKITLNLEGDSAKVRLSFLKAVEVDHEFVLDDGQEEMKLPAATGGES